METQQAEAPPAPQPRAEAEVEPAPSPAPPSDSASAPTRVETASGEPQSLLSVSGISSWAKNLKIPQTSSLLDDNEQTGGSAKSTFARLTSGFNLRVSPKSPVEEDAPDGKPPSVKTGVFGTITKGFVDSSKNAVKAVQVKARHVVSQNKRRYQEGGFDLDMTYITENIIAMGFPAGDMSSGLFGYFEGFYRNHMEEVIKFFETNHKGKYKVYNLCSERLYDASLLEGKVASFPFDDHNCPPLELVVSFCQSAYSWLKEDIENVVAVHCKAGTARTGLMISSLLLYLKFFPTAEESIDYYNQKRCVDGKGLILPSQIRYVKYFERVLTYFNGEVQPSRRCMLRGFRLHRCPYWLRPSITVSNHNDVLFSTKNHPRTKDLMPEDFWFSAPKKGIMVFALPGEPGLTEVAGDFKIHFHDRQGDFYCWLNTTMIENRKILNTSDLDGFDKRKLPSPGFQVEVVLVDYDGTNPPKPTGAKQESYGSTTVVATSETSSPPPAPSKDSGSQDKDDVFSDSEAEESGSNRGRRPHVAKVAEKSISTADASESRVSQIEAANVAHGVEQISIQSEGDAKASNTYDAKSDETNKDTSSSSAPKVESSSVSEFRAIAADASVFSFGDEDEYESE